MFPAYQGWCRRASRGFRSGTPALFGSLPVFPGWSGRLPVPPGWSGCLPVPPGWSGPSFLLSLAFLVMQWKVVPHKEIVPRGGSCWCRADLFRTNHMFAPGKGGDVPRRYTCRCKFPEETTCWCRGISSPEETHVSAKETFPHKKKAFPGEAHNGAEEGRHHTKTVLAQSKIAFRRNTC